MAFEQPYASNVIALAPGDIQEWNPIDNRLALDGLIKPGLMVEKVLDAGVLKWQNRSSATALIQMYVALQDVTNNENIDKLYTIATRVYVGTPQVNFLWNGLTDATFAVGAFVEPAVGGKFVAGGTGIATAAGGPLARFVAETVTAGVANTRFNVRRVQ